MRDSSQHTTLRRPTPTLKWAIGVESVIGYILVPFYVVLKFVVPHGRSEACSKNTRTSSTGKRILHGFKSLYFAWIRSIGVAAVTGALTGAAEWVLAKLLGRRMLDGAPAVATGIGIPALMGGWLIDPKNRRRGAFIAVGATLPRIILSESWRRDLSTDEEFDQRVAQGREQLFQVLREDAERKQHRLR